MGVLRLVVVDRLNARIRLWGLDEDGTLFRVDKSTGEATVVSTTLANTFGSLALDAFAGAHQGGDGPATPALVPALSPWATVILLALLLGGGFRLLGRRPRRSPSSLDGASPEGP